MNSTEAAVAGTDTLAEERQYWLEKLTGGPRPSGPRPDRIRPEGRWERNAKVAFQIEGETFEQLSRLTGGEPFLEHAALMATLTGCLYRYTQASPIAIGCPAMKPESEAADTHNVVAIVNNVDGQMTFRQLLLGVRQTLLDAHAHQRYPFARLLVDLGLQASSNGCPLFDVSLEHRELHHEMEDVGNDIALTFERKPGGLRGTASYNPQRYEPATIERFGQHFVRLLHAGLKDPRAALDELDMLPDEERRRLLVEWNDTTRDYPRDHCVHELFEAQVERAPEQTALVDGNLRLSYRELDQRANQLAHYLQGMGVTANAPVGICLNRSADLVVAVLAVLKAGGAYVPYDPTYPTERMSAMLEDVKLKVLLTRQTLLERLPKRKPRVVCVDNEWPVITQEPTDRPLRHSGPDDLCYIIFTSGSTGRPKSAAVYHRGWTNLLCWFLREFSISPLDKNLVMSSISFDITQRSMAMPLTSGGELHLVPDGYDPNLIRRILREEQITLLNCAPSTFYPLIESAETGRFTSVRSLRCLFLGGEAISASRLMSWALSNDCSTELVNVYGAAECSDVSSFYRLHDFARYARTSVPIGKPIDNSRVYLLDESLRLVPIGAVGEICLAGDGVGRGYINDPALTARKFLDDPFAGETGGRLYRTGDLGRYLADGTLEFLGRMDHQVKIRGLRIELGEIETLLRAHPRVKEAVAVAAEHVQGDQRLTAYYTCAGPDAAEAGNRLEEELREVLAQKLPAYMIPNLFVRLGEMPLNPNGKIDREALPAPSSLERPATAAFAAPRTPTEATVATLFAEVLKVEEVGRDDHFFRLGGHSLMATQMIASISEAFKVRFPAVDFFARPTVAAIAERIEAIGTAQKTVSTPAARASQLGEDHASEHKPYPAEERRAGPEPADHKSHALH
ncbi:MAG TPA: amino acid adenylation domain-containing protein [Thermoanaerobaculia bacterium]|nr:amino acid adenylation domain-containing protein [Thermoanaerobaculia bacterium]